MIHSHRPRLAISHRPISNTNSTTTASCCISFHPRRSIRVTFPMFGGLFGCQRSRCRVATAMASTTTARAARDESGGRSARVAIVVLTQESCVRERFAVPARCAQSFFLARYSGGHRVLVVGEGVEVRALRVLARGAKTDNPVFARAKPPHPHPLPEFGARE